MRDGLRRAHEDARMTVSTELPRPRTSRFFGWTLLAGFAGGLVDLVYFSAKAEIDGSSPIRTMKSIASFWLGKAAAAGGMETAALGLATHFGLATIMALVYGVATSFMPALRRRPFVTGPIYGLILYAVMYLVVLPLRWPSIFPRFDGWTLAVLDGLVHIGVGTAIALVFFEKAREDALE